MNFLQTILDKHAADQKPNEIYVRASNVPSKYSHGVLSTAARTNYTVVPEDGVIAVFLELFPTAEPYRRFYGMQNILQVVSTYYDYYSSFIELLNFVAEVSENEGFKKSTSTPNGIYALLASSIFHGIGRGEGMWIDHERTVAQCNASYNFITRLFAASPAMAKELQLPNTRFSWNVGEGSDNNVIQVSIGGGTYSCLNDDGVFIKQFLQAIKEPKEREAITKLLVESINVQLYTSNGRYGW